MATIQLILTAINKASGPLQAVAASAQQAADMVDNLNAKIDGLNVALGEQTAAAAAAAERLNDLAGAGTKAAAGQAAATAATRLSAAAATAAALGWGAWGNKMDLFGGALKGVLPAFLTSISFWHLAIEAAIEFGTTLLEAGVAVVAFGAYAAPTFQHIYVQLQGIWSASNALNTAIYPLQSSFQGLARAVQPEAYQLFGLALVAINQHAGEFSKLAASAGQVLDQLGGRLVAAISSGSGFSSFLADGSRSLSEWGNIVGNIGGIFGNIFRVLPGYANVVTHALEGITAALEAITASPVVQWLLGAALAFHGFIVWVGLAATGVTLLGNAFLGMAGKLVPALASISLFDAAQLTAGLQAMITGLGDMVLGFLGVSVAEEGATGSTLALAGAMGVLDAVSPMLWIVGVTAAIVGLVYAFSRATSATSAYDAAIKSALGNTPVTSFAGNLAADQARTVQQLAAAQQQLAGAQQYTTQVNLHTGNSTKIVTAAYQQQTAVIQGYRGELQTLSGYQSNYNAVLKAAGGDVALLSAAGITSNQIMGASGQKLKQLEIEAAAAAASFKAMALGTGRNAAALNALNYAGDTTNNVLGSMDVDMQKVVTGMDDITNVVLGGEQALNSFESGLAQMRTDATAAGAVLNGLSDASITLGGDFYSTMLPAMQKTIDAMELQLPTTQQLTQATGDMAAQLFPVAKGNQAAEASLITLINNALGPGTVSFQNLAGWIAKNGGSLSQLNQVIGQTTVQSSVLANTLGSQLNASFAKDLLQVTGAQQALSQYTADLVSNTATTAAGQQDRLKLITDLEQAGLNASQAQTYVNQLTTATGKVPANVNTTFTNNLGTLTNPNSILGAVNEYEYALTHIPTSVSTAFSVTGTASGTSLAQVLGALGQGHAAGGYIRGPGSSTSDSIPAWLSSGEYVVRASSVDKYGKAMLDAINTQRFAAGGMVRALRRFADGGLALETPAPFSAPADAYTPASTPITVGAGAGGPMIHIDSLYVRSDGDVTLIAQRLSHMLVAASMAAGVR